MQNGNENGEEDEEYQLFLSQHSPALNVFDAGEVFGIMQVEEKEGEENERRVNPGDELTYKVIVTRENGLVFLVDHAWTYRVESTRQQLLEIPGLLIRMASLMGLPFHGEAPDLDVVDLVLDNMWKYNQTYQLSQGSAEEKMPVWYIMDEFGSRVQHSSQPTCCMAPLFHNKSLTQSGPWELQNVMRDFAYGETDSLVRRCHLAIFYITALFQTILQENKEKLPVDIQLCCVPDGKVIVLNLGYHFIMFFATLKFFFLKSTFKKSFSDSLTIRPRLPLDFPIIAQMCLKLATIKGHSKMCSSTVLGGPGGGVRKSVSIWYEHHLPHTVQHISFAQIAGYWQELEYTVVSKYLEDPVLSHREEVGMVKLDIHYMVLLRSVEPLRLYMLVFLSRVFSLDHFDDYQKHYTVMNYASNVQLKPIHYDDFIPMFESQYLQYPWKQVETNIFKAFSELFQAASCRPAPYGVCAYPSSRAISTTDLMLKWNQMTEGECVMQPQKLEVNFNPDGRYHPMFYDHMCSVTQIL
uniref:Tubulin tyrosine ligase-like family, member 12 n=1 Tax=Cyprinus carpio carpio TaxID=630221 RepID=A0A8C0YC57_CYPCA